MKDSVIVLFTAKAYPGKETELKELLISGITASRHDPGNVSFELNQLEDDPSVFFFYEEWVSEEALNLHLATPGVVKLKEASDRIVIGGFAANVKKARKLRPEAIAS